MNANRGFQQFLRTLMYAEVAEYMYAVEFAVYTLRFRQYDDSKGSSINYVTHKGRGVVRPSVTLRYMGGREGAAGPA